MAFTSSILSSTLLLAWNANRVVGASPGLISGATLFTGPAAPVVDIGYGKFQGKSDNITGTHNYLGKSCAVSRFDTIEIQMPI
jgi:hypothetical protein